MPGRLRHTVHVRDEQRRVHTFAPGDHVPEWAARKITNRAAWEQAPEFDEQPEPTGAGHADTSGDLPPASATKDVWLTHAADRRVEIPAGATKAQIIEAVTAASSDDDGARSGDQ